MTPQSQFRFLFRYFWIDTRPDLKWRLVGAVVCLVLAKVSNLITPWLLGQTVDSLDRSGVAELWVLGSIGLVLAYALSRLGALVFSEGREVLFTAVSQHAIRSLTGTVFSHLHRLPLPFHLSRHTGSLDRLIDRGTKAVDFLLEICGVQYRSNLDRVSHCLCDRVVAVWWTVCIGHRRVDACLHCSNVESDFMETALQTDHEYSR